MAISMLSARSSAVAFRPTRGSRAAPLSRRAVVVRAGALPESEIDSPGKQWLMTQPGISAPFNTPYFDPLGFSTTQNPTLSVQEAKRWRESELAHGRVSMLAALGWIVQEEFHPLFGGQVGGPAFRHFQGVEAVFPPFWYLILTAIGIAEGYRLTIGYNDPREKDQIREDYQPGNLGFDPLGLFPQDKAAQLDIQTKELNNGRLAMIAIAGFAAQEEVDHITIWKGLVKENIVPASEANLFQ